MAVMFLAFRVAVVIPTDTILIIIDRFIKVVKYIPITKKVDIIGIIKLIYRFIFLIYNWLNGIVSDRGAVFISAF